MTLEDHGYDPSWEQRRQEQNLESFDVGRVISEHRERYVVRTGEAECDAEIIGQLRYSARSRSDFPAVGDWVAISLTGESKALIHAVLHRKTLLERQAAGKHGEKQLIAANIDTAFIVQAVDRDFSINRTERYLAICHAAGVEPMLILSKTDTIGQPELEELVAEIRERLKNIPLIPVSNETRQGYDALEKVIEKNRTYCLLGSSGAGKSTLINNLSGKNLMKTGAISQHSNRGRHVTSHRELIVLENGGILIDNPGMREVGMTDTSSGISATFDEITQRSGMCRYKDCTHTSEIGCAVIDAVENGEIDHRSYENYLKMLREQDHFKSTLAERRKKDKDFGKFLKNYKKAMKRNEGGRI
jgi:ribosome biogenesis GTPase